MATALLSLWADVLRLLPWAPTLAPRPGSRLSPRRRSCLPRTARSRPPHRPSPPCKRGKRPPRPFEVREWVEGDSAPEAPGRKLYGTRRSGLCVCGRGDPEGNFGENQLLDRSIGLSPLCPPPASDSHVSGGPGLHQSFPWLRPGRAKIAVFRVSAGALRPRSPRPRTGGAGGPEFPRRGRWGRLEPFAFASRAGLDDPRARAAAELLGPCFKTGRWKPPMLTGRPRRAGRRGGSRNPPQIGRAHV